MTRPSLNRAAALACLLLLPLLVTQAQTPQPSPLVAAETAFNLEETFISKTGLWMWWIARIRNPNLDAYCEHPSVTVTARNAKGEVVGTYDKNLVAFLGPGAVIAYVDNLEVLEPPAKVEVTHARCSWGRQPAGVPAAPDFGASGVKLIPVGGRYKVAGEVTNPLAWEVQSVNGAVLFRDSAGKLLGGEVFYIRNLPARSSKPFMEDLYFDGAWPHRFDKVEFMVFPTSRPPSSLQ